MRTPILPVVTIAFLTLACRPTDRDEDGSEQGSSSSSSGSTTGMSTTDPSPQPSSSGPMDGADSTSQSGEQPPLGPCEDDPAPPRGDQTGMPIAQRTWEAGASLFDVAVDDEGGDRILVGRYSDTITFGDQVMQADPDSVAGFVGSLSASGELSWFRGLRSSKLYLPVVRTGQGGAVYVSGGFGAEVFIDDQLHGESPWEDPPWEQTLFARFDGATGQLLWFSALTSEFAQADHAEILPLDDGGLLVSIALQPGSWMFGTDGPFETPFGVMVAKLDHDGELAWRLLIESSLGGLVNTAGLVAVEGGYVAALSTSTEQASTMSITVDGEELSNGHDITSYLVHLDANGDVTGSEVVAATSDLRVTDMATTACSDLVLVGDDPGGVDLGGGELPPGTFVLRRTLDGDHRWSVGVDSDHIKGVVVDDYGQPTVSAVVWPDNDRVERLSVDGELVWSFSYSNGTAGGGKEAVLDPMGGVILVGTAYNLDIPPLPGVPQDSVSRGYMIDLAP